MMRRCLWVVVGVALAIVPFGAAQLAESKVLREPDIVFAQAGDTSLRLDVARPAKGPGPFPAVVCLHGGGWVGGDRKQMTQTLEVLARRGYVAIAPDYRLAPAHRFPAAVEDCKAAVRWLRANAPRYRVDRDRIGVVGLMAGGHLACMLAVTGPSDGLEGSSGNTEQPSKVQAVVSFSAPTDLSADVWDRETIQTNLVPFLGGTVRERPEEYRRASPLSYPGRGAPPMLLLHGTADPVVPLSQVEALARKVQQAGGSARVYPLEGEGHAFRGEALYRAIDQMLTFLDQNLKKP